jgi:hypothetical protein
MPPAGNESWILLVILPSSVTYPFFLAQMLPKVGFWKGSLQLLLILTVAIISGFVAYLLWYAYYEHKRLGIEFHLFEALGWTFGESLAFYVYLEVAPAAVIACLGYPIGFLASRPIRRVRD